MIFGNKIVVSKDQKELVVGISKYAGSNQSEISYNIVEFGVAFLIALSYERKPSESDEGMPVTKLIEMWNGKSDTSRFSDAVMKFLSLENKKDYYGSGVNWLTSFIGVQVIDVASEQKSSIKRSAQVTGFSARATSHCVFESGITFMMLASSTPDEVKDSVRVWAYDDDIMKIAHSFRDAWDSGKEKGVASSDSVDMRNYGLKK
jgi:hypothetical protein